MIQYKMHIYIYTCILLECVLYIVQTLFSFFQIKEHALILEFNFYLYLPQNSYFSLYKCMHLYARRALHG